MEAFINEMVEPRVFDLIVLILPKWRLLLYIFLMNVSAIKVSVSEERERDFPASPTIIIYHLPVFSIFPYIPPTGTWGI